MFEKYVGRTVEIIYMDRTGRFTKRRILLHAVRDGRIKAFCLDSGAPRTFRTDGIMAVQPAVRKGAS